MSEILTDGLQYLLHIFSFDPSTPLLFTQVQFWVFFAFVYLIFASISSRPAMRNAYLFFISLLFYYKTSGCFVGLLLLVTFSDFVISKAIYHVRWSRGEETHKRHLIAKALLCLSVIIDLGILCYFKYSYFLIDILNQYFGMSLEVRNIAAEAGNLLTSSSFWDVDQIILPVGISFYTFQLISYTADVYKGIVKPVESFLDFGFYVSFFPQLVAGPIVKASVFVPQLYRPFHLSRRQFGLAVFWILNGLVKKIILSDYIAVNYIDRVFANPLLFSGFENISALFAYSLQIYADFSGYTDIAIGLSLMMGFYLPSNFNSPYQAYSCQNFWKRWHISLSSWLQNYLYFTLGGNRNATCGTWFWLGVITLSVIIISGSVWITIFLLLILLAVFLLLHFTKDKRGEIFSYINTTITMLLGGLWHGASLNFIVWGGLNGLGIVAYKIWHKFRWMTRCIVLLGIYVLLVCYAWFMPSPLVNVLLVFFALVPILCWFHAGKVMLTFIFITFTWLFFRSGSNLDLACSNQLAWGNASAMIHQIGSSWSVSPFPIIGAYWKVFVLIFAGFAIHWTPSYWKRRYRLSFAMLPLPAMAVISVVVVIILYQFITSEMQPFIYFQF